MQRQRGVRRDGRVSLGRGARQMRLRSLERSEATSLDRRRRAERRSMSVQVGAAFIDDDNDEQRCVGDVVDARRRCRRVARRTRALGDRSDWCRGRVLLHSLCRRCDDVFIGFLLVLVLS